MQGEARRGMQGEPVWLASGRDSSSGKAKLPQRYYIMILVWAVHPPPVVPVLSRLGCRNCSRGMMFGTAP